MIAPDPGLEQSGLCSRLLLFGQELRKVCFAQSLDQLGLSFAPQRAQRAGFPKWASPRAVSALVERDGAIDGFHNFQDGDLLGSAGQRHAAARPA